MDVVTGPLSEDTAPTQRGGEILATREFLDLDPGAPDLRRAMRVAPDRAGNSSLCGERRRPDVVLREGFSSVEDLDAVDLLPEALEHGAS